MRQDMMEIGHRRWAIAEGYIPPESSFSDRTLVSHETACILNAGERDAHISITLLALAAKVLVITGGPGVGKTTVVNAILRILSAKGVRLLLCASTGRAAKRMNEATGFEAKTIHRLLEVDSMTGGFRRDSENPLDCDLLVIDETSMVDVLLMHALLEAMLSTAALLVVGDVDQLPSVGPGQVLADMIASGAIPLVRLPRRAQQALSRERVFYLCAIAGLATEQSCVVTKLSPP
jgi:ATP-dependent exoDNAse (exonuclease V) alpha subunit